MKKKIVLIVCLLFSYYLYKSYFNQIDFDSNLWKKEERNRYRMIDNIIHNGLFIGKNRNDIKKLLGTDCFKCKTDFIFKTSNEISYIVKIERKGINGIQFHFMNLTFKNEKVVSIEYYNPNDGK